LGRFWQFSSKEKSGPLSRLQRGKEEGISGKAMRDDEFQANAKALVLEKSKIDEEG
jgi:hypothetical protein